MKKLYIAAQKSSLFTHITLLTDEQIIALFDFNINFLKKIIFEESVHLLNDESESDSENDVNSHEYDDDACCQSDHCSKESCCDEKNEEDESHDLENDNDESEENIDVDEDLLREYTTMMLLTRIAKLFEHIVTVYMLNNFPHEVQAGDFSHTIHFLKDKKLFSEDDLMMVGTLFMFVDEATSEFIFKTPKETDENISLLTHDDKKVSNVPVQLWYDIIIAIEKIVQKLYGRK